jgi:hypothetical protein
VVEVGARSKEAGGYAAGGKEVGGWKLEAREISPDTEKRKKASKHGGLEALLELQRWV